MRRIIGMSIQRIILYVEGMTCSSCESRITKTLASLSGVASSKVSLKGGTAEIEYDNSKITVDEIKTAIGKTGYAVKDSKGSGTAIALGIGLLLVAAYLIAGSSGLFAYIPRIDASIGYAMLFAIGILTSIHCVAMCGGIALSQSLDATQKTSVTARIREIVPALKYNAGRVLAYTIIGGIVGAAGSVFSFSPMVKGIIAGLAGLLMIVLALRMLGLLRVFPRAHQVFPKPLRDAAAKITAALRKGGPFGVGLLNGLMPCGPLQTMQLYALGTGSALGGALSMLIFSLGTVPLLFLFGVTANLLPRKFVPVMIKASAVLVMFLGVVTFARAATLAGIPMPFQGNQSIVQTTGSQSSGAKSQRAGLQSTTVANGRQTIVTEFKNGNYVPFSVKAGVPLIWTIRIAEQDITGCNGTVIVPAYGIRKELVPGDNVIEFTPSKAGTIAYSCWMGMIRSSITVVGDNNGSNASGVSLPASPLAIPETGTGSTGATCSCCSGL